MFDLINFGGHGNYRTTAPVDNSKHYYATGEELDKPTMKYVLIDAIGECEVERSYIKELESEDGVEYGGMMLDTFNNQVYYYYLR